MSQEKAPEISKSEFVDWNKSNVTKFITEVLQERRENAIDAVHVFVRDGKYAKASYYEGMIAGIDNILDIEFEDVPNEA